MKSTHTKKQIHGEKGMGNCKCRSVRRLVGVRVYECVSVLKYNDYRFI